MASYKVTDWNNFCRVLEMPSEWPKGFCAPGGNPVTFMMVDWFKPVVESEVDQEITLEELEKTLTPFIKQKLYIKPDHQYLVICNFGASFIFNTEVNHGWEE